MTTIEKIKWLNRGITLGKKCRNLTGSPVGEAKTANIYAGDEDRAEFLVQALGKLGINAEYEIFTVDGGEYFVGVNW